MTSKIVYKIRHNPTGLFSTGGNYPNFESVGKTWNTKGAISNHLANAIRTNYYQRNPDIKVQPQFEKYRNCEIIEYEVIQSERPAALNLHEMLDKKLLALAKERLSYDKERYAQVEYEKVDGTKVVLTNFSEAV